MRGRGEEDGVDAGAVEAAQTVQRRRDAHRHAVFVAPGDGALGSAVVRSCAGRPASVAKPIRVGGT